MSILSREQILAQRYRSVRQRTERLCAPLSIEDHVPQPTPEVSPPKWHLGHTAWFVEHFVLLPHRPGYAVFDAHHDFLFNSYYESVGVRVARTQRGHLSRPTVAEVLAYRAHVDAAMGELLSQPLEPEVADLVELGLQHEQQHQELLVTDIKFILGVNARPALYDPQGRSALDLTAEHDGTCPPLDEWIDVAGGTIEVGHTGRGFAFDNESPRHTVLVGATQLRLALVTNQEYLDFMADGGYERHELWHAEGWDWVRTLSHRHPCTGTPTAAAAGSTSRSVVCSRWRGARRRSAMSATTKPLPSASGPAGGCRQSSNGRQALRTWPGAAAGNGRKAPTSPTRGFAAVRVPSVNTTASSWSTSRCCVEPRSPRHRVMRA